MKVLKSFAFNLLMAPAVIFCIIACFFIVVFVVIGPAIMALENGNNYWFLLYIPFIATWMTVYNWDCKK